MKTLRLSLLCLLAPFAALPAAEIGWDSVPAILARIKAPQFPARDFAITSYGDSNCVPAVVTAVTYMGTHTSVECSVGGHAWKVSVPPDQLTIVGDRVYLSLPQSRVWLMSSNGGE